MIVTRKGTAGSDNPLQAEEIKPDLSSLLRNCSTTIKLPLYYEVDFPTIYSFHPGADHVDKDRKYATRTGKDLRFSERRKNGTRTKY